MIRPRTGDFVYTELELQAMERDIGMMVTCGAVGLVMGCLTTKGGVDTASVTRLVNVARAKLSTISLTFHRAIDLTRDIHVAAEHVSHVHLSSSLSEVPLLIFSLFSSEWWSSASWKGRRSCSASATPTLVLPQPAPSLCIFYIPETDLHASQAV